MKALIALAALCCAAPALAGEGEMVFEKVRGAVVTITALDEQNQVAGEGSGVVIGPGKLVTNCHVVQDALQFRVRAGAQELAATVLAGDLRRDLCLLEAKGLAAPAAAIRLSSELKPGEPVFIVGNPLGFGLAVGSGLVSTIQRSDDDIRIYTSAPAAPGSSGGGLFDAQGRLVGIVTSRYLGAQNFNMALPAEWITELLKQGAPWKTAPKVEPDPEWMARADALRDAGDWVNLELWARSWQESWPTASLADTYLGLALWNRKKEGDARTALSAALEKDPYNAMAYGYRACVRRILGDKEGAFDDLRRAQSLYPANGYFRRIMAEWLREDKEVEGAIAAVATALLLEPWDWNSWELLGELRHGQQRHQEAERAYRTVLRLKPGHPGASTNLASILAFLGQPDAARRTLAQGAPVGSGPAAMTWSAIGTGEEGKQRFAEAERAYRKALELDPELYEALNGLGNTLLATGRHQEAEASLRKAVQLKPGRGAAWVNLGILLKQRGDRTGAEEAFQKATAAEPSLAPAWFALGGLQHELRAYGRSAAAFAEVVRLDPGHADAWGYLGEALARSGQGDKGIEALRKAESLNPKSEVVLTGMAFYYGGLRGDQTRALEYVERGLAVNPVSPGFWSSKGYGLLKLKRYPEAVQALETAIRLQPDFPNAWINLGEAQLRQNQVGKAIVALEKGVQLVPSAADARLYLTQSYALARQYDKAQSHLDMLIRQAPGLPSAWGMQLTIFLEQNKKKEALVAYDRLKALNPDLARTLRAQYLSRGKQFQLPE